MTLLRALRWLLIVGLCVWAASTLTRFAHIKDQLLASFLTFNPRLPSWMSFEEFLAMGVVACVLVMGLVLASTGVLLIVMRRRVSLAQRKQLAQEAALQHAIERLKMQVQQEYDRLIGLSSTLTQRLDKRAILQNILQAAGQITSVPQADSAVGMWVLDFDTDRMQFEMGIRCDETFFTKHQFEISEPPFRRLFSSKQVLCVERWQEEMPFVVADKVSRLGKASALILVPLIIERTLLGALVVFCHPDILTGYQHQQTFFNAAWGQLTLALAIAIQGELAIRDRLTGIVNQTYFLKRLAQEIDRSNRYQLSLGLLMIDIDNFKAVNDTLGHPQGDAILKITSKLIRKSVRAMDLVGRYGGEEFVVMLPETGLSDEPGGMTESLVVAERIRKAIEEEFHDLQKPLSITVSIGVAVHRYPQDRQLDARELIRVADEQLYKAKTSGKNRCCVHLPEEPEPVS